MDAVNAAPETSTPATPPVVPGSPSVTPKTPERMYQVTINGKTEKWPESRVIERAQKAEGAEVAMKKSAEYEKAFGNFVAQVQDPRQALALFDNPAFKYDSDKKAALATAMLDSRDPKIVGAIKEWIYKNEVEPSQLDPRERAARESEHRAKVAEKRLQDIEASELRRRIDLETQQHWNNYRTEIAKQVEGLKLPMTERTVERVARKALMLKQAGQPADIARAATLVKQELREEYKERFMKSTDEDLFEFFDEEVASKVNSAWIKRLQAKQKQSGAPKAAKTKEMSADERKKWVRSLGR